MWHSERRFVEDFTLRVEPFFGISLELLSLSPTTTCIYYFTVVLLVEVGGQFHFISIDYVSLCWDFHILDT